MPPGGSDSIPATDGIQQLEEILRRSVRRILELIFASFSTSSFNVLAYAYDDRGLLYIGASMMFISLVLLVFSKHISDRISALLLR